MLKQISCHIKFVQGLTQNPSAVNFVLPLNLCMKWH